MSPDLTVEPPARPQMTRDAAERLLHAYGITGPALLGRRGYFWDTMHTRGTEGRGVYDDAIFVVTPTVFRAFNANCDPSVTRPGMARLKCGTWDYKLGIHNLSKDPALHPHYLALVQAEVVTVERDAGGRDTGWFGINIHKGGFHTTSSEGCQTIVPEQWDEFIGLVKEQMTTLGLATIPYVLTERDD